MLLRTEKALPQPLRVHLNGFSPVWLWLWMRSDDGRLNALLHDPHTYRSCSCVLAGPDVGVAATAVVVTTGVAGGCDAAWLAVGEAWYACEGSGIDDVECECGCGCGVGAGAFGVDTPGKSVGSGRWCAMPPSDTRRGGTGGYMEMALLAVSGDG